MTLAARPRLAILFVALSALFLSLTGAPVQAQDGSVPDQPTGLSTEASHDRVNLTWDDPNDASITHYQVLRRDRDVHDTGESSPSTPTPARRRRATPTTPWSRRSATCTGSWR